MAKPAIKKKTSAKVKAEKVTKPEPKTDETALDATSDNTSQTFAKDEAPVPKKGSGGAYVINPETGKRERA